LHPFATRIKKRRSLRAAALATTMPVALALCVTTNHRLLLMMLVKIKQMEQISNGWRIHRNVRVVMLLNWIGQIVAAAFSYGFQVPVAFDKLGD